MSYLNNFQLIVRETYAQKEAVEVKFQDVQHLKNTIQSLSKAVKNSSSLSHQDQENIKNILQQLIPNISIEDHKKLTNQLKQ